MTGFHENLISVEEARTLDGLFARRVHRSPSGEAYQSYDSQVRKWRTLNWGEMAAQVARWQHAIASENLQEGDRVAILLRNCPEWVMFDQASMSQGLVMVPLYTDDRPDNASYILDDAAIKLILVQDAVRWKKLAPALSEESTLQRVVLLDEGKEAVKCARNDDRIRLAADWLPESAEFQVRQEPDAHALASIVYTSGTTGRPKGVMLSHNNMLSVAHGSVTLLDCYEQDVFLSFLPLSHTLERTAGYYLPIMSGSKVAYARSIPQLADDLQTIKPTVLMSVPRIFERVYGKVSDQMESKPAIARKLFEMAVETGWHKFEREQGRRGWSPKLLLWPVLEKLVASKIQEKLGGQMRVAVSGGAALAPEIAKVFIGLGITIVQGYGLTETSPVISVNPLEDNVPSSVGIPLRSVEVKIGDNDELLARGPGIMMGYWNNHSATKQVIDSEGWLHTGDQARIENNHIFITGRLKDILVLSNGEKIPPGDMELAIALDPDFEQVMIVGEGKPYLTALVVLNEENWPGLAGKLGIDPIPHSLDDKKLKNDVLKRIRTALAEFPGYAKVRQVSLVLDPWSIENGLITPTMKIKRAKVLEHHAD
ncbi:MAG: AMP-dependent synthetase/ligase, partial [bacterium]